MIEHDIPENLDDLFILKYESYFSNRVIEREGWRVIPPAYGIGTLWMPTAEDALQEAGRMLSAYPKGAKRNKHNRPGLIAGASEEYNWMERIDQDVSFQKDYCAVLLPGAALH
jgi:hypothetical protein